MRSAKRARQELLQHLRTIADISDSALAAIVHRLHEEPGLLTAAASSLSTLRTDLGAAPQHLRPELNTELRLPLNDSSTDHIWNVCLPQHAVPYAVSNCPAYKQFMAEAIQRGGGQLRLVLYHDELVPGNALRPDNRRKFSVFYYAFLDFRQHLRNELSWLTLGIIRHELVKQVKGGMSGVMRILFRGMFDDRLCITGIPILLERPLLVFWNLHSLVADEAALKSTWGAKGAAGIRPCMICRNVLKLGTLVAPSAYLCEINEPNVARFDVSSDVDVWTAVDNLLRQRPLMTKAAVEQLEKASGLNANEYGVLADQSLREFVKPTCTTYDAMHCYFSHGAAATEMHLFLEACNSKLQITFADFERYASADWQTSAHRRLTGGVSVARRVFCSARESITTDSFKGMASELMSIFPLVRQLAKTTMCGQERIKPELDSFTAMAAILDLLQVIKSADYVTDDMCHKLQDLQRRHLELFQAAYTSACIKPKHHFCMHLASQLRRDRFLLDAFVHERKHKSAKKIANRIQNTSSFEDSVVWRLLNDQFADMQESNDRDALVGRSIPCREIAAALAMDHVEASRKMIVNGMHIAADDVLIVGNSSIVVQVCLRAAAGFLVLGRPYEFAQMHGHGKKWRRAPTSIVFFRFTCAFSTPAYWSFDSNADLLTLD